MQYRIDRGSTLDRALLLKLLRRTYREILPDGLHQTGLTDFVDDYLTPQTPLWWARPVGPVPAASASPSSLAAPLGGLWLTRTRDRATGDGWAQILWLYVRPDSRRQGIATALLGAAEAEASRWGCDCLALQVFDHNQGARSLYRHDGFEPHSRVLTKPLRPPSEGP